MSAGDVLIALGAGLFTGLVSSILGVGGALVIIPFMLIVFNSTQHVAEGTSLVVIVPTAIAGALAHARNGLVDTSTLKGLILGGIAGVLIGGFIALQTDGDVLRAIYTGFVFFLSYRFLKPQKVRAR